MGVYDDSLIRPLAEVLMNLGLKSAMVLHGHGGLDELSLSGPNHVVFFKEGEMQEFYISPKTSLKASPNIQPACRLAAGKREDRPGDSKRKRKRAKKDVVALNAGAAFLVVGAAKDLAEGVKLALRVIEEALPLTPL